MKTKLLFITVCSLVALNLLAANNNDTLLQKKQCFYNAKIELENMLSGKIPLNYERAVFITENAFYENKGDYNQFKAVLDFHTKNIKKIMQTDQKEVEYDSRKISTKTKKEKQNDYDKALANWAIFQYMTDTTFLIDNHTISFHIPFQYSIDDPMGTTNWGNSQVFSLLNSNIEKGNCYALTSLYKIFSERLNSDAILTTLPGHIFITHNDTKGITYNIELATRSFPGIGTLSVYSHTPDKAIESGIAFRKLNLKQSVSLCLVYLAKSYEHKFNIKNDNFSLQCAETTLKYDSLNLNAMLLKAEVLEENILNKTKTITQMQTDKQFKEYEKLITKLFNLGYLEMPEEMQRLIITALKKEDVSYIKHDYTPQPFSQAGVKTRYATLSWGLFDEQMNSKPIEKYNRTLFDTKKKKIIQIAKVDTINKNYQIDPVVFAWSIDPMAKKYPYLSPYSAFGNNPILITDPGGDTLKVVMNDYANMAIRDVASTLPDGCKSYLKVSNDGLVSLNLSRDEAMGTNDPGVIYLWNIINTQENYQYGVETEAKYTSPYDGVVRDISLDKTNQILNLSKTPLSESEKKYSPKPANKKNSSEVTISPDLTKKMIDKNGKPVNRAGTVLHELIEAFKRTTLKEPYKQAHKEAIDEQKNLINTDKRAEPGTEGEFRKKP
jgi:hypothetical protein